MKYYLLLCILMSIPHTGLGESPEEAAARKEIEGKKQAKVDLYKQKLQEVTSQRSAFKKARENKEESAESAQMLGTILTMVGGIMMASTDPPTKTKGQFLIGGGIVAMVASFKLKGDARKLTNKADELKDPNAPDSTPPAAPSANTPTRLSITSPIAPTRPPTKPTGGSAASIPKGIKEKFESALNIPSDDFIDYLTNGGHPADILGPALGTNADALKQELDSLSSSIDDETVASLAREVGLDSSGASFQKQGGGKSRAVTAVPDNFLSGLNFKNILKKKEKPTRSNEKYDFASVSPEVKKALNKAGHREKNIFHIVKERYQVVAPMLLGRDKRPTVSKYIMKDSSPTK